ncbi:tetraacyldisaccharide 4'-kinase [Flagellimonas taeanensis]|uniref:tetraacyldisaccharide 4'-kinase n=1 Tax=Flavobacteriaceae TaxID=49546 RepID=UPI000E6A265B|nr:MULTISPECIES: tetraacyldisaccharide 4'-kinase [Allomuricauda]MDC6384367.1 tetraacyldisaccharide 4'-kinase [Muricauda sp. SK9]RIV49717.1 tetraacyldisaccharide 4'-kinase [Allomuricauda taeanensis]RIV53916.1 tetraacyldisaccharide 4'-kinase [Allomuricauda taeanensis]
MQQLLRKIAFPFSLIYALVVHLRNALYDVGVFTSISYGTPTICVGNLSVGGTGKTPMTEYLIRMLQGQRVAVLSRGYKRKSEGFLLATPHTGVLDLGDEPYQLKKKFPEVAVAVDADRRNGIAQLEEYVRPEVIILDDAFQHRRVKPAFSILLTMHSALFVDDWYLPTGNLRDAKKEAQRADVIIVTKCPASLSSAEREQIAKRLRANANQKVLFATLEYHNEVTDGGQQRMELLELKGKQVALVTGIASPQPLVTHLNSMGIQFEHFEYGDHHHFTDKEIQQFKDHEVVLTTEKDFVRLEGRLKNLFYVQIAHSFDAKDRAILEKMVKNVV